MPKLVPFRTANKIKALSRRGLIDPAPAYQLRPVPRYQPAKQQRMSYAHVHGLGTWMVDVAFFANKGQIIQATEDNPQLLDQERKRKHIVTCLICIHCNSRFAHVRIMNGHAGKDIQPVLKELTQLSPSPSGGWTLPCDTVISDADPSIAHAVKRVPRITRHITYNMSDNSYVTHSMLAIIDRFTRTLRDMLFTADVDLTPKTLQELVHIYNNAPHATLSRVMRFEVTPTDMITHLPLQEEFIRRVSAANVAKSGALTNAFNVGDIVYVYQPPHPFIKRRNTVEDYPYRVLAVRGGRYLLQSTHTGRQIERPRSYLVRCAPR